MPRPNPPRKRPRRRPDSQERSARAEVSLAKQTAQVKEKNGSADGRQPSNAKQVANVKGRPAPKGGPATRARRIDEPFVPWAGRSYLIGGFASSKTVASTVSTPTAIGGLIVIDILSFVATFYLYPWLYKFMRRRPPPRTPPARKPKQEEASQSSKSIVDRMDEASARDPQAKDPMA